MPLRDRLKRWLTPPEEAAPVVAAPAPEEEAPTPPEGARNFVVLILDSCRYDSWVRAQPRLLGKLGPLERRWTYATWTAPSHYNLLVGLLPHPSPPRIYASEYYKQDFLRFRDRLGLPELSFSSMVPHLWLPTYLRSLGYRTNMYASMPVLNPTTPINRDFDTYRLMERHNDAAAIFEQLRFYEDRPSFFVINTGETHYPYATPDEPENEWPRISGVNGVFKHLDDHLRAGGLVHRDEAEDFFDEAQLRRLHQRQVDAVRWVDRAIEALYDLVPPGTWITITADHGELFGEEGYFGHGPIQHHLGMEVPFVEGLLR